MCSKPFLAFDSGSSSRPHQHQTLIQTTKVIIQADYTTLQQATGHHHKKWRSAYWQLPPCSSQAPTPDTPITPALCAQLFCAHYTSMVATPNNERYPSQHWSQTQRRGELLWLTKSAVLLISMRDTTTYCCLKMKRRCREMFPLSKKKKKRNTCTPVDIKRKRDGADYHYPAPPKDSLESTSREPAAEIHIWTQGRREKGQHEESEAPFFHMQENNVLHVFNMCYMLNNKSKMHFRRWILQDSCLSCRTFLHDDLFVQGLLKRDDDYTFGKCHCWHIRNIVVNI